MLHKRVLGKIKLHGLWKHNVVNKRLSNHQENKNVLCTLAIYDMFCTTGIGAATSNVCYSYEWTKSIAAKLLMIQK